MVAGFWYGFSTAVSLVLAAAVLRVVWRRHLSWRTWTIPRFIPEPEVGRWQVWAVSRYPSGGERLIGRYRVRWTAQRMADWFQRTSWDRSDTYEVRPVRAGQSTDNPEETR